MFESAVLPEKPPNTEKIFEISTDFLTVRKTSVNGEMAQYLLDVYESLKNLHNWRIVLSKYVYMWSNEKPPKNRRSLIFILFRPCLIAYRRINHNLIQWYRRPKKK